MTIMSTTTMIMAEDLTGNPFVANIICS